MGYLVIAWLRAVDRSGMCSLTVEQLHGEDDEKKKGTECGWERGDERGKKEEGTIVTDCLAHIVPLYFFHARAEVAKFDDGLVQDFLHRGVRSRRNDGSTDRPRWRCSAASSRTCFRSCGYRAPFGS